MPRSRPGEPVHRIECECGFAVEGDEDEAVDAARRHAGIAHGVDLADGIVRALARPITARTSGRSRFTTTTDQETRRT